MTFAVEAIRVEDQARHSCAARRPRDGELHGAIAATFDDWIEVIADGIGIVDRKCARSFASLVLTAIEGGYDRGRAGRSTAPFVEAARRPAELAVSEDGRR